uniref:SH2 domain-containing protein n=1 Tax=Syphacia muris TaxID=451379 RepID=A0A0N5AKJ6_9BILA
MQNLAMYKFKPLAIILNDLKAACRFRLLRQGVSFDAIENLIAESNGLCITESEQLSKVLLHLPVRWQPDRYVLWDSSKENATKLVREVMDCNPDNSDGIFVIRPSQSQEGHYALTVSKDNRILHCLIEQRHDD